jgi:DUF4097 and DUF4098 domain-containing protein YvlB
MYEFHTPEPVDLVLRFASGDAEIVATDTDQTTVEVTGADGSDADEQTAARTRVELHDGTLLIDSQQTGGWGFRRTARLRVRVRLPAGGDLMVKVASADVRALGTFANANVSSASGDLSVEHVTGSANFGTASGQVRVGRVDENLRLQAASGGGSVDHVGGNAGMNSASGDLELGWAGGAVKAVTASGDVRIGTATTDTVNIKSASGDVSIGVAAGTGVWLDLNSASGDTHSDLAMSDGSGNPNGATLTLQVRTASGDIDVRRSAPARQDRDNFGEVVT